MKREYQDKERKYHWVARTWYEKLVVVVGYAYTTLVIAAFIIGVTGALGWY